jgi:hypothetical protein
MSKKTLGWRTLLVVPELETELRALRHCSGTMQVSQVTPPDRPCGRPSLLASRSQDQAAGRAPWRLHQRKDGLR